MKMNWQDWRVVCCLGALLSRLVSGLQCDCTTDECIMEGTRTCHGNYCYSETRNNIMTNGCIDQWTILCENRHSSRLIQQPVSFCCSNRDYCNKNVVPTKAPKKQKESSTSQPVYRNEDIIQHLDNVNKINHKDTENCPCALNQSKKDNSKMINPIYIAVPVAGVCVLLALIIFAMYLLRRRNVYYERYQYPRTMSAHAQQPHHAHHHHHNTTDNTKCAATSCKINRCTDSERSSSGSESKLFI